MLGFSAFRYTGCDKNFSIEDPFSDVNKSITVGHGNPFLVPYMSREFYLTIPDFEEIPITSEFISDAILQAISGEKEKLKILDNKIKILFYAPDEGGYTGARYHAYQIALALARSNCYVHFVTPRMPPYFSDLGTNKNLHFEFNEQVRTNTSGYDIVIAAPPQSLETGMLKAQEEGCLFYPICFEPNEILKKSVKELGEVLIDESEYYKKADKIIVNSDITKNQVSELWEIEEDKIIVVNPAINIYEIDVAEEMKIGPSLVYVGRAAKFKGIYDFIDLLIRNDKDLPRFTFYIISREADYIKSVKGQGTERHPIKYYNNISDYGKFQIMKGCTAGIQLSKHEGFGMVPVEFMACGKPVLCSPIEQIKKEFGDKVYYADKEEEICNFINVAINGLIKLDTHAINFARRFSMDRMLDDVAPLVNINNIKEPERGRYSCKIEPTGRPRILFVTKYSYDEPIFGGAESTIKKHAQAMRDVFGFDIFYAFSLDNNHKPYDKAKAYKDEFAWRFEIPRRPFLKKGTEYESYIMEILDIIKPDIVLTYGEPIMSVGLACKQKQVPYVISVNFWRCLTLNYDSPENSKPDELNIDGINIIKSAKSIIANSEYTKDIVHKLTGRGDSTIIYSPVYPEQVIPSTYNKDMIGITVCESGESRYLLNAITSKMPEQKFLIGKLRGEEPEDADIKSRKNVEYLDGFKDPREFYKRVKLVLIITPTLSHSFCKTGVEAMLNGIPVVASKKGNLPYLFEDSAILLETTEIDDWINAINKVLSDKELYKTLSDKGIERSKVFIDKDLYLQGLKKVLVDPVVITPDTITLECPEFPGVKASLRSIEAVVPGTKFVGNDYKNKHLSLLSGWIDGYPAIIQNKKAVMLDWHSPISQSELSGELGLMVNFMEQLNNHNVKKIFFRDEKTAEAMRKIFGEKIHWLPNVIDINGVSQYTSSPHADGFHVSIFCPGHPRKNIITQTIAAKIAGAKLHINDWIASKGHYSSLINKICPDVEIESLDTFDSLLRAKSKMHLGLEVTWTESFNYSLLEYLLMGVPVLAPATTPAFEEIVKDEICRKWLVIENPGDPIEIADKIKNIKENGYISSLKERVNDCIMRMATRRNEIAIKALGR